MGLKTGKMKKFLCAFIAMLLLFSPNGAVAGALDTDEKLVGWEDWRHDVNVFNGETLYFLLYSPQEELSVEDVFYYVNKLISENTGIIDERYGAPVTLLFGGIDLGEFPNETMGRLINYFTYSDIGYADTPLWTSQWTRRDLNAEGEVLLEIRISSNEVSLVRGHRYNEDSGAYERVDVEYFNTLEEIYEYRIFGARSGTWVQNANWRHTYDTFGMRDTYISQCEFEIFDADSFDESILNRPYVQIINPAKTEGNYVLVDRLSLIDVEAAVKTAVSELCEDAIKASDSRRGQLEYINGYLCENVDYDHNFADWNSSGRETNYYSPDGVMASHAYGALIDNLAICTGFSHAVAECCNYLDIPNFYIVSESHMWNMVYVDGEWKMIDATWNATSNNKKGFFLVDNIRESTGSHDYDAETVKDAKKETLAYWEMKSEWDRYLEYGIQHRTAIESLVEEGILKGDGNGDLNLHMGLTRAELAVILTRLNGEEERVKENASDYAALLPFEDVPPWAAPYVGYCYEQGLMKGYDDATFGAGDTVDVKMASTVILRYLNTAETDWGYNSSVEKIRALGIMPSAWPTGTTALRNDIAVMIDVMS